MGKALSVQAEPELGALHGKAKFGHMCQTPVV